MVAEAPLSRVLYECYRDRDPFDAHERQPHTADFLASLKVQLSDRRVEFQPPPAAAPPPEIVQNPRAQESSTVATAQPSTPAVMAPRFPATRTNATNNVAGSHMRLNRSSNRLPGSAVRPTVKFSGASPRQNQVVDPG